MIKQIHIDNGKIGGVIQIITQSMFIVTLFNFVGVALLIYDRFLKDYVSLSTGFIIMCCGAVSWWGIYYVVIVPSILQYSNRQGYKHGNPIKKDFELLNARLDKMEEAIKLK